MQVQLQTNNRKYTFIIVMVFFSLYVVWIIKNMLKAFLNTQITSKSKIKQNYKLRIKMSSSMIFLKQQNFAQVFSI